MKNLISTHLPNYFLDQEIQRFSTIQCVYNVSNPREYTPKSIQFLAFELRRIPLVINSRFPHIPCQNCAGKYLFIKQVTGMRTAPGPHGSIQTTKTSCHSTVRTSAPPAYEAEVQLLGISDFKTVNKFLLYIFILYYIQTY